MVHPHSRPLIAAHAPRRGQPPRLRPRTLTLALGLAFAATAATLPQAAHAQSATALPAGDEARQFDIPAGPLRPALDRFARTAGVNLSYDAAQIDGASTRGVGGRLGVAAALRTLLAGSGLEAVAQPGGGYSLRRAAAAPPPAPAPAAAANAQTLAEVTVSASADTGGVTEGTGTYTPRTATSATRMPLSLRETPQSVTVITSQQIEDRGVTGLAQALETTVGVRVQNDMARPSLYSRGLAITNLQIDGNPMFPSGQAMTSIQGDNMIAYDRIEVLRGANGLLTGPGDPSGTVTMVRKRPTREFQAHVQGGFGSWRNKAGEVDVSGPLNAAGTVRARLAAGAYGGDYFTDEQGLSGKALLATVEADLTPRTVLRLGYQHDQYTYEGYTGGSTVPLWYSDGTPYHAPRSQSTTPRALEYDHRTRSVFAGLEHEFDSGWKFKSQVDVSRRNWTYPNRMFLLSMPNYPNPNGLGATLGSIVPRPNDDSQWAYNFDFQGPVSLFGREHRLMFGASGWDRRRDSLEVAEDLSGRPSASFAANYPTPAGPSWFQEYPYRMTGFPRSQQYTQQHGIFAAARWNLADSLKLITGVRVTHWKTRTDLYNGQTGVLTQANSGAYSVRREITPYIGAVWDFHPNLSAYASYADIFKPQNTYDANDDLLRPVVGKNYEAGLKGEFLDKKLNASLAVFRVVQDNLAERDPNFPSDYLTPGGNSPYRSAGKGITTRGLEAEISGALARGWNIGAGYTYAKSKNAAGETYDGDQPVHLMRVFTTYRFQGDLSGLTLGVGGSWNSAISRILQKPTGTYQTNGQPVTAAHEFRQGSVLLLNAMARYQFTRQLSLTLNVDNLLDKKYYNSIASYAPVAYYGTPRRFRAAMRYQF